MWVSFKGDQQLLMKNMKFYMTLMKTSASFLRIITKKATGVAKMTGASTIQREALNHKSRIK